MPLARTLLHPGSTCQQVARADRVTVLLDNDDYFRAAGDAIRQARHCVLLLGWCFDPRTPTWSRSHLPEAHLGALLQRAVREKPSLEVYIVCWDMPLLLSAGRAFFPQRAKGWFRHARYHFILDKAPGGACHHQKVLVVDDALAFCSGADFLPNRWDSSTHLDDDPRRLQPLGHQSPPRHSTTMLVQGPAAALLGEEARDRVARATGHRPQQPAALPSLRWPGSVPADSGPATVGIARTHPGTPGRPAVQENLDLWLSSIAAARETIYLENQYLASPLILQALAGRLAERDGPEVVVICSPKESSWFDRMFMGTAKRRFIPALYDHDRFGRLQVYAPRTQEGQFILIHSKLTIVDDRFLRVGSANLNNRSFGLDSECDAAIDAEAESAPEPVRAFIRRACCRSLSHFLGCRPSRFAEEWNRRGSLISAVEAIDPTEARLCPVRMARPRGLRRLIAKYEIGDPYDRHDALRPWVRQKKRQAILQLLRRGRPNRPRKVET